MIAALAISLKKRIFCRSAVRHDGSTVEGLAAIRLHDVSVRRSEFFTVALIVIAAAVLSGVWALRVPFFQLPDEVAHADYAFAYLDAGQPFRLTSSRPENYVTPEVRYLMRISDYRKIRYDTFATVPTGYGSPAFFAATVRGAPQPTNLVPQNGAVVPYAMTSYPPWYYWEVASVMRARWSREDHSLVRAFQAGRLFNIALLVIALVAAYGIFFESGLQRWTRLALFAGLAFLPITSWLFASIQPDNQSAAFMNLSLYLALRVRRLPTSRATWAYLGVSECVLALTKLHYGLVTIVAVALANRSTLRHIRSFDRAIFSTIVIAMPCGALFVAKSSLPAGIFGVPALDRAFAHADFLITAGIVAKNLLQNVSDAYLGGITVWSFWMGLGLRSASVFGRVPFLDRAVRLILPIASMGTVAFAAVRQIAVLRRIAALAAHRSFGVAVGFLGNDVLLNAYVLLTLLLFGIYSFTNGFLTLQGRYWYPAAAAMFTIAVATFGRLAPSKRNRAQLLAASTLAVYSLIASPSALVAMTEDFYGARPERPRFELGEVTRALQGTSSLSIEGSVVNAGVPIVLEGAALDSSVGLGASRIQYRLDGRAPVRARTHLDNDRLAIIFNDPMLRRSGFLAVVPTVDLRPGAHVVTIEAIEARAPAGIVVTRFTFEVAPQTTLPQNAARGARIGAPSSRSAPRDGGRESRDSN